MARPEVIYRHSRAVRITHWVNALVLLVLLMSGLQIFNAHPALYLGEKSDFDKPILAMRPMTHDKQIYGVTTVFGRDFDTTGLFGLGGNPETGYQERGFPWWATLPGHRNLSMGRRWHFFFAWLFVFNGLAYLLWSLGSGHLRRDLAPSAKELKHIGTSIAEHVRLKFPKGERACRGKAMSGERKLDRRSFVASGLAATSTVLLGGCEDLSDQAWVKRVLDSAETLTRVTQEALLSPQALAREFTEADLSREFRANGSTNPDDPTYMAHAKTGFAEWKLVVGGQVEEPLELSLAELRAMPSRTQITRHDCVEGWSCIGKWRGVPLSALLTRARLKPAARYIVFYCADSLGSTGTEADQYYESIGLADAFHAQTILAYEMNDQVLPVPYGAPLRLRVERQLGYKMAKYVMSIEAVDSLADIRGGRGGYWEDLGYEWYAGI